MNDSTLQKLYSVETALKVAFFFSPFFSDYSSFLAAAICMMAVFRRLKRVEFSRAFLQQVIRNEYGCNLFFILAFVSMPTKGVFFYAPLMLHFLTGIIEYVNLLYINYPLVQKYANHINQVRNHRKDIMTSKAKIEFVYMIVAILSTVFNFSRIMSTFVFCQYVLVKVRMHNEEFLGAISEIDGQAAGVFNKVGMGGIYEKIRGLFVKVRGYFN